MKLVIQVKLVPDSKQDQLLATTLHACNKAANQVSEVARSRNITKGWDLRKVTYAMVKELVPGAQAAQHSISKVAQSYTSHRSNVVAGRYGKRGTKRRAAAEQKVIVFRDDAAQPYDKRILSWKHHDQQVSIWVIDTGAGKPGRITVPFTGHPEQLEQLAALPIGESDLINRDGSWYLMATVTVPEGNPHFAQGAVTAEENWIGVDLGINQLAVTSDKVFYAGKQVVHRREQYLNLRNELQRKRTKSAKRLLRKRRRKESRWMRDLNHCIAKKTVAEAKRTERGISVEELTGIRERVRHRKSQRATFSSWAFAQLGGYLEYKSRQAGVPFVQIDSRHTSQRCYACGHVERKNRDGEEFLCRSCGVVAHADLNASMNIRRLGPDAWVQLAAAP